jgi:HEPN domain-containing protein
MLNDTEAKRLFIDAQDCYRAAGKNLKIKEFRTTVQNSQLCIELCCKAIIALFEEPKWVHNPSTQLLQILNNMEIDKNEFERLCILANKADEVANWHGWSTYGKEIQPGKWISATQLCTKEVADELYQIAKMSFNIAKNFLNKWGVNKSRGDD